MTEEKSTLRSRLAHELREYAVNVAYLWVTLGALVLFKAGVLRQEGVSEAHLGVALGKALILGKFLMIGEAARLGARGEARPLLVLIARKVLAFFVLLVALFTAEEFVVGWLRGTSFAATLAAFEARSLLELIATCLLVLLVITPLVATRELARALGAGRLRRLLLERPERNES